MVELIHGFAWRLPKAFAEAVNLCRFEQGDIIYDNPIVYRWVWRKAIPRLKISIQVKTAAPSIALEEDESQIFAANWESPLILELTDYPSLERHRVKSTQGRLYTALWKNDISLLTSESPAIPKRWKELGRTLRGSKKASMEDSAWIKENEYQRLVVKFSGGSTPLLFALFGDSVSSVTTEKIARIKKELSKCFKYTEKSLHLEKISKTDFVEYAPTTQVTLFLVHSHKREELLEVLKSVLYKPAPNPKNPDRPLRFNLNMHGFLIERAQAEFSFGVVNSNELSTVQSTLMVHS
jgi:hypothetical protein